MGKKKKTDESQQLEYAAFWERIDNLGVKIGALDPEKDEAVLLKLSGEVFDLLYRQFGGGKIYDEAHPNRSEKELDALGEFFLKDWGKFDGSKGTLSNFIQSRLERRGVDMFRKDFGVHSHTIQSGNTENTETETDENARRETARIRNGSLDAPVGTDEDGQTPTQGETIAGPNGNPESETLVKLSVLEFFALAQKFHENLGRKANNADRVFCYRLCNTDEFVLLLKAIEDVYSFARHERDILNAMHFPFLDYFMEDECRTLKKIVHTAVKSYSELTDESVDETDPKPLMLQNGVYYTYLTRKEKWTLSRSRTVDFLTEYKKFANNFFESVKNTG